ncbi:MAG TPA: hypothetical protein VLJ68_12005 [Chitinophagaceae bacterium]|nr:hypothetical protein [Chitinophagaceae bacterium]
MKFVKLALISIVLLAITITLISFFFPSHIRISRATNMKTIPDSIWYYVDDPSRWDQWNTVRLASTSVNWKEKNSNEHIAELQNKDHRPVLSGWKCISMPQADSITVQWYIDFKLRWYPWEKFGSLVYEKVYGAPMEQGLNNLKSVLKH